jgi:hypothetical protein
MGSRVKSKKTWKKNFFVGIVPDSALIKKNRIWIRKSVVRVRGSTTLDVTLYSYDTARVSDPH